MQFSTLSALTERRSRLGRAVLQIANKKGPLTPSERVALQTLTQEIDFAERDVQHEGDRRYDTAFREYLRHGRRSSQFNRGVSPEHLAILESRDMGTGGGGAYPGATTGFLSSLAFDTAVTSALRSYGGVVSTCTFIDTSRGGLFALPSDNDATISGRLSTEASQVIQEDIAAISQVILGTFRFDSNIVRYSRELAEDAGFDLPAYLAERLGIRLSRIMNQVFTNGTGSGEPHGLVTGAAVGAIAVGTSSNDGSNPSLTNTIGTDDLAALEGSVDPAYRQGAGFMCHANTLLALRKVKDKEGRSVFPGLAHGGENTLLNYPVVLNNDMEQLQSTPSSPPVTVRSVAFGDFSKYVIRRGPHYVQMLFERFADLGQVAALAFQRADGALVDGGGGAVKVLTNTY